MRFARMAAVALALMTTACLDTTDPNVNNGPPPMSATIEGTEWHATGVLVTPTETSITLGASNEASNAAMSIAIAGTGPGTYPLGPTSASNGFVAVTTGQVWSTLGEGGSGTIVVTTFANRHIAGTFNFTAVPSMGDALGNVHVTDGKFDFTY